MGGRMEGTKKRNQNFSEELMSKIDSTAGEAEWAHAGTVGEHGAKNMCIETTAG